MPSFDLVHLLPVACGLILAQLALTWRLRRRVERCQALEDKVSHLTDVVSLLTETSEAGFRTMGNELSRLAELGLEKPRPAGRRTPARGAKPKAARAADANASESEVRLRQYLDAHTPACPCASCAAKADPDATEMRDAVRA